MAEIARLTGFDRAAARRLCMALEECGYLVRQSRSLRLSPKVVAIAGGYLSSHAIGKSVQPILNLFAERLNGEISLVVLQGHRALYIARSAVASARLSFGFSIGSTLPLLPTAVGRMLLAQCPEPLRDEIIETGDLQAHSGATDMARGSIRQKIVQAARQGYACSVDEFELGATGLAVPTLAIGESQAVLATTASTNQFSREGELERALDVLRHAAISLRG